MQSVGFWTADLCINTPSTEEAARVVTELNNLKLDVFEMQIQDNGSIILYNADGEYYNEVDDMLEKLAKWADENGYIIYGKVFAEIDNERYRAELSAGTVDWCSLEWISNYSNRQIQELKEYAQKTFNS